MEHETVVPRLKSRVRLLNRVNGSRELLGFAELIIAGAFVIKDICIVRIKREGGEAGDPFVSFPSKKGSGAGTSKYFDVAHPITAEAARHAREVILQAYREAAAA